MALNSVMTSDQLAKVNQEVNSFNSQLKAQGLGQNQLGKDDFLKLLVTQLQYQDPSSPMEDTQFISQMAQFSSLEQMTNMADGFNQLSSVLGGQSAESSLGKNVTVKIGDAELQGQVTAVNRGPKPEVKVNGQFYPWQDVASINL
jgi:flagellar basal-body rod modification protein FlgD